jgi:hypothetical protein
MFKDQHQQIGKKNTYDFTVVGVTVATLEVDLFREAVLLDA